MIFWNASKVEFVTGVLYIVDQTLLANLLILIIFSGYENFVSITGAAKHSIDRPRWMGGVDFAGLKLKLIGSIVALSAINLLAAFLEVETVNKENLGWMVGIYISFVVTGLIFALSERVIDHKSEGTLRSIIESHGGLFKLLGLSGFQGIRLKMKKAPKSL